MASVTIKDVTGKDAGKVDLDEAMFGIEPNVPVLHQVVTAQLAARRAGTQSTKTRAEVRGGGRKPFKQKGTGNARQGSIRAPHFSGGGVALGPKPRKYDQKTPKKMIRLALRSALSDRAAEGKVVVLDSWGFDGPSPRSYKQRTPKKMIRLALRSALSDRAADGKVIVLDGWGIANPKTKDGKKILANLGMAERDRVLLVLDRAADKPAALSFRNLGDRVHLVTVEELNAYDVLVADYVVFSSATLEAFVARAGDKK